MVKRHYYVLVIHVSQLLYCVEVINLMLIIHISVVFLRVQI